MVFRFCSKCLDWFEGVSKSVGGKFFSIYSPQSGSRHRIHRIWVSSGRPYYANVLPVLRHVATERLFRQTLWSALDALNKQ